MAGCPTQRKWFHVNFKIKDKSNGDTLFSVTSIDDNDLNVINNSNIISVKTENCASLTSPPKAFEEDESPGFFYFRPTVAQLAGTDVIFSGPDVFIHVESYDDVIDESNRRNFEYEIEVAYRADDTFDGDPTCTTSGPPDTLCDEGPYETTVDDVHGLAFRWSTVPFLTEIGCCDIELGDPGIPTDPPGNIQDCARIWVIAYDGIEDYSLQYYDFDVILSSEAHISRGKIVNTGGASTQNEWHDLAWDDRNMLWGLENNGIKRILPGSEDIISETGINGEAIALDYITIKNTGTGIEDNLINLFSNGITNDVTGGKPAMSYSQTEQKLYIYAGQMFFELSYVNDSEWEVIKSTEDLGIVDVGDLAFDVLSNCYCSVNNNLSKINFSDTFGFGTIEPPIGNLGDLAGIVGMDFILDLDNDNFVTFYGVHNNGILYELDVTDGSKTPVGGVSFQGAVVGMSSCQAGEDLNVYEDSITSVASPLLFVISLTSDMAIQGTGSTARLDLVKNNLITHITSNISDDEQISFIVTLNDLTWSNATTFTNVSDAIGFIENMETIAQFPSDISFCGSLNAMFDIAAHNEEKLKSCTVIVGSDVQCFTGGGIFDYMNIIMAQVLINLDPDFVINTIAVNTDNSLNNLLGISSIGGGTHTVWRD